MKVLHVIPSLFDSEGKIIGGAERYALELARFMATRVPTRLVSFGERDQSLHWDSLPIRVIGGPHHINGNPFNPFQPAILREFLAADVVHCHQEHIALSRAAAIVCRLSGRRVFATDHGGGAWDPTARLPVSPLFHGHLHVSEFSRRQAGRERQARVIHGGVDSSKFSPSNGLPALNKRAVLFVGRLLPHKGVDYLIEGLPDGLALDVAGPPLSPHFLAYLHGRVQGKPVRFHYDWDDSALLQGYRRALCVVLPSVYRDRGGGWTSVPELLGQTLLEAMACGRPVICTKVGGMPELVEDGVTGFVVPPNDPRALHERLSWLREHPEQADRLGAAARRRVVERFAWPAVVTRCLDAYRWS